MPEPATDLLAGLTDAQRQAVEWGEDPLLVLAGPGSGKTRVLTARIARLLRESPDRKYRILGLTFTNKAATEMRDRVLDMVPEHSERLFLGTFHGFCASVLRLHGAHIGIRGSFRIYSTRADQDAVLAEAVEDVRERGLEIGPGDDKLIPVIDRLRARLIAPADAPAHVTDDSLADRITAIYEAYDARLRGGNALDFASLLYYTVHLMERYPAFGRHYRSVYPYWCVDEFQDTNIAQYRLLQVMAGGEFKNIMAVADDDQLIYGWNGASHQRIREFVDDFHPQITQLTTNFRCPQPVVELANRLISHNQQRLQKPLASGKPATQTGGDVVRLFAYKTDREEADATAADIAERHAGELEAVAILARNRRLLPPAKVALDRVGLQAVIAQRRDEFVSAPYGWLHACLRQSNQRRDVKNFEILCAAFAELSGNSIDADDVMAAADASHQDYLRRWAEHVSQYDDDNGQEAARAVMEMLVRRTDYRAFVRFATDWLQSLAGKTKQEQESRFPGYVEDRRAWNKLFNDIKQATPPDAPLDRFLQELAMQSKEPPPPPGSVTLMTIHAAKGKEFAHVYLVGLVEDELPSFHALKQDAHSLAMEEERRNCFVAFTRARETLTLSFAASYRGWGDKQPSRFLAEAGLISECAGDS